MKDFEALKEDAKQYIRYDKDKANKIAYLTFARPEVQNAMNAGCRQDAGTFNRKNPEYISH